MKSLRNLITYFLAFALAAFAVPGLAQNKDKLYQLSPPTSLNAGATGVSIAVGVMNVSPDGNSTIKSFTVTLPTGVKVTERTVPTISAPFASSSTPIVGNGGTTVTVNDVSPPIKSTDASLRTLTLNMSVDTLCTFAGGNWTANVRTGSSLGGQPFDPRNGPYPTNLGTQLCNFSINTGGVSPPGSGTISCSPNPVPYGGSTTCTTTPSAGYGFISFGGDCSGTSGTTCTLTPVTSNKTITATFGQNAITATPNPAAGGTVSCTPNPVPYGGSSSCSATENAGYTFANFSGDCSGTICTLNNVTTNQSVTANFTRNSYTVTGTPSPTAGGTVTCTSPVLYGDSTTCTATANPGYALTGFTGCSSVSGSICTLTNVTENKSVTANFGSSGVIGCSTVGNGNFLSPNNYDPDLDVAFIGTPGWGLRRGANTDNNGTTFCNFQVNVQFTFDPNTNTASVFYDKSTGENWSAKHVLVWTPVPVDANGDSAKKLYLSWGFADPGALTFDGSGNLTNNKWVPALACVDDPPDMSQLTATQLAALLPVIPDNAAGYVGSPWTQYQPGSGKKAMACKSQTGSTSVGPDGFGNPLIQYWHKVIDQSDLWVGVR